MSTYDYFSRPTISLMILSLQKFGSPEGFPLFPSCLKPIYASQTSVLDLAATWQFPVLLGTSQVPICLVKLTQLCKGLNSFGAEHTAKHKQTFSKGNGTAGLKGSCTYILHTASKELTQKYVCLGENEVLRWGLRRVVLLKQSIHKVPKSAKHAQPFHRVGIMSISLLVFTCPLQLVNL